MATREMRRSPYQGLIPYGEDDAPFFFGRERETRLIVANLFASPLTLLYGASGVGKSSVLRAGAVHALRQRDDLLVSVFSTWQADPVGDLKAALAKEAERAGVKVPPPSGSAPLARYLAACSKKSKRRLMIILDQFEEYFLYHPQEGAFDAELPRAVLQRDAPTSFLISLREDALAKLDRFEGRIPTLFDNYLRVDHLDREAARAAIEKPIARYNQLREPPNPKAGVERKLVAAVLRQVATGQVTLQEAGQGVVKKGKTATASHVETPYLQMVMTRLWNEEVQQGFYKLRLTTLERLGGAESIVRTHLDTVMSALPKRKQDIAARVFHHLVTPSGTKIAHTLSDLSDYVNISEKRLAPVLEDLQKGSVRVLRRVASPSARPDAPLRYEIFHDVLAAAILDWRARYVKEQERAEAEKKLEQERKRAEEQARAARRLRELAAEAKKARAEAVRQERLAVKRQAALEKAIAAIADPDQRGKFQKYLINTQKHSSKEQRRSAAGQKKTGRAKEEVGNRWPGLKLWQNGLTLRVHFMDGDPSLQTRVAEVAREWTEYANLRFEFGGPANSEIRVSFKQHGSWSYVGTDAINIPQTEPTINFGWLTKATPQHEVRRVVLHEFGHVFGLIEEINSPNAKIPWNKEVVYREMTGPPNFWDKRQVDTFFFTKYSKLRYREFDPTSVMMFSVQKHLTLNGFEVGTNTTLSQGDKEFVRKLYPPA